MAEDLHVWELGFLFSHSLDSEESVAFLEVRGGFLFSLREVFPVAQCCFAVLLLCMKKTCPANL